MPFEFDVFLNHASEDKQKVAEPLYHLFTEKSLKVWMDKFEILIGSSLREEIDKGLLKSEFAVAILSKTYFTKPWALSELDALFALEKSKGGKKRILPVLHEITFDEVLAISPLVAGKMFGTTANGLEALRDDLLRAIRPDANPPPPAKKPVDFYHGLDDQALEFLKNGADGNGNIRCTITDWGVLVNAGGTKFEDDTRSMPVTRARYKESLRQLEMSGYMSELGRSKSGVTYELTQKAFDLNTKLKAAT